MKKYLPIVDVFAKPYEVWSRRDPSEQEAILRQSISPIKVKLLHSISTAEEAAKYILDAKADNSLAAHVRRQLVERGHKEWRASMPKARPSKLGEYLLSNSLKDLDAVSNEIDKIGAFLSSGQALFHGGELGADHLFRTSRPLSTTFCPQVALRSAEQRGKAYDAGELKIYVLMVRDARTAVYVSRIDRGMRRNEMEVTFSAGATIAIQEILVVDQEALLKKFRDGSHLMKKGPAKVVLGTIS